MTRKTLPPTALSKPFSRAHLKLSCMTLFCLLLSALSGCATLFSDPRADEKARAQLQLAVDQFNKRKYSEAIEATRKAIAYQPEMAEAYNHMALIYMETKRYKKSHEAFQQALALRPGYSEVLNNMGVLYNREKRYREAIEMFTKALKDESYITPQNAQTNMGYSYFRMGHLAQAKAHHQKALDIMPNFCLASKNMGDVYIKEKRYKSARRYFEKATENCPLYQEARYKLGLVLAKLGDKKMAKSELDRLVRQHKKGPFVDSSHEVLKYLQ